MRGVHKPLERERLSARLHDAICVQPSEYDDESDFRIAIRASQFSRYLLERTGIPDRDKNARLNTIKLIKYSRFRAFLAPF